MRRLRELVDKGAGLHNEGLALRALHQQGGQLKAGLAQGYLKLRSLAAIMPCSLQA